MSIYSTTFQVDTATYVRMPPDQWLRISQSIISETSLRLPLRYLIRLLASKAGITYMQGIHAYANKQSKKPLGRIMRLLPYGDNCGRAEMTQGGSYIAWQAGKLSSCYPTIPGSQPGGATAGGRSSQSPGER